MCQWKVEEMHWNQPCNPVCNEDHNSKNKGSERMSPTFYTSIDHHFSFSSFLLFTPVAASFLPALFFCCRLDFLIPFSPAVLCQWLIKPRINCSTPTPCAHLNSLSFLRLLPHCSLSPNPKTEVQSANSLHSLPGTQCSKTQTELTESMTAHI